MNTSRRAARSARRRRVQLRERFSGIALGNGNTLQWGRSTESHRQWLACRSRRHDRVGTAAVAQAMMPRHRNRLHRQPRSTSRSAVSLRHRVESVAVGGDAEVRAHNRPRSAPSHCERSPLERVRQPLELIGCRQHCACALSRAWGRGGRGWRGFSSRRQQIDAVGTVSRRWGALHRHRQPLTRVDEEVWPWARWRRKPVSLDAVGGQAVGVGIGAQTFGWQATAAGTRSTAIGRQAQATARGHALGDNSRATLPTPPPWAGARSPPSRARRGWQRRRHHGGQPGHPRRYRQLGAGGDIAASTAAQTGTITSPRSIRTARLGATTTLLPAVATCRPDAANTTAIPDAGQCGDPSGNVTTLFDLTEVNRLTSGRPTRASPWLWRWSHPTSVGHQVRVAGGIGYYQNRLAALRPWQRASAPTPLLGGVGFVSTAREIGARAVPGCVVRKRSKGPVRKAPARFVIAIAAGLLIPPQLLWPVRRFHAVQPQPAALARFPTESSSRAAWGTMAAVVGQPDRQLFGASRSCSAGFQRATARLRLPRSSQHPRPAVGSFRFPDRGPDL